MADEVEWVQILADFLLEGIERQPLVFQFIDNSLFALRGIPALKEVIEADKALFERAFRELLKTLRNEPAIFVEIFDAFREYSGPYPIDIHLAHGLGFRIDRNVRWLVYNG